TQQCTGMFPYGTTVTITARADASKSRLVRWQNNGTTSGLCAGSTDPTNPACTFTVPASPSVAFAGFDWYAYLSIAANSGDLVSSAVITPIAPGPGNGASCPNTTKLQTGLCVNIPLVPGQVNVQYGTTADQTQGIQDTWAYCVQNFAGFVDVQN